MTYFDYDERYMEELARALRTPQRRTRMSRLRSRLRDLTVYRKRTGRCVQSKGGSPETLDLIGVAPRALHRTRTGDPFLTIQTRLKAAMWLIALWLGLFWLIVGLLLLRLFGGPYVP